MAKKETIAIKTTSPIWMPTEEVMALFGLKNKKTLFSWARNKKIPANVISRKYFFSRVAIHNFIETAGQTGTN